MAGLGGSENAKEIKKSPKIEQNTTHTHTHTHCFWLEIVI